MTNNFYVEIAVFYSGTWHWGTKSTKTSKGILSAVPFSFMGSNKDFFFSLQEHRKYFETFYETVFLFQTLVYGAVWQNVWEKMKWMLVGELHDAFKRSKEIGHAIKGNISQVNNRSTRGRHLDIHKPPCRCCNNSSNTSLKEL